MYIYCQIRNHLIVMVQTFVWTCYMFIQARNPSELVLCVDDYEKITVASMKTAFFFPGVTVLLSDNMH